jgi:putative transposase
VKRSRFSVEQIVAALKQVELGLPVADAIRQVGISEQTFYRWKKLYGGLQSDQVRELKQLAGGERAPEAGGGRFDAGQGDAAGRRPKKMARPALKGCVVDYLTRSHGVSERRACRVVRLHRSNRYYRSIKDPRHDLRARMRETTQTRVRYGYRRVHVLLRREGWHAGKNQIYRIYQEEQLQLRSKRPRRRKMAVARRERFRPRRPNDAWAMDFVADQLVNGKSLRALTIVDVYTREALAIDIGQRLGGEHVVAALNRLAAQRGRPRVLFMDNGSEFTGRLLDLWAYHHKVQLDFSRPGKPTDNSFVESFNGSLRDECLNVNWFETLEDARAIVEAWRADYNESRPHMAHNGVPPGEFARRHKDLDDPQRIKTAED